MRGVWRAALHWLVTSLLLLASVGVLIWPIVALEVIDGGHLGMIHGLEKLKWDEKPATASEL